MNKKENNTLKAVILSVIPLIIVVVIFATAMSSGMIKGINANNESNGIINDKNTRNLGDVTATIIIDFGNGTTNTYGIKTTNATVYGFLMEAAKLGEYDVKTTYYSTYDSLLIESISDMENRQDNKYWIYYINNASGSVAADKQVVINNDIIEWRFEEFTY